MSHTMPYKTDQRGKHIKVFASGYVQNVGHYQEAGESIDTLLELHLGKAHSFNRYVPQEFRDLNPEDYDY